MISHISRLPTVSEFVHLRGETVWGVPTFGDAETAIARSFCGIVAMKGDRTVGMARCVGDGILILYIQDVIIAEDHRGRGIGQAMIRQLISQLESLCAPDCTIGLFAATGQSGFYERLGFSSRKTATYGPGMHAKLDALVQHKLAISKPGA